MGYHWDWLITQEFCTSDRHHRLSSECCLCIRSVGSYSFCLIQPSCWLERFEGKRWNCIHCFFLSNCSSSVDDLLYFCGNWSLRCLRSWRLNFIKKHANICLHNAWYFLLLDSSRSNEYRSSHCCEHNWYVVVRA